MMGPGRRFTAAAGAVRLYSYWRSSSAWRVRIVLAAKGIAYEYVAVNIAPAVLEQRRPEYSAINPLQQVPTLEWDEAGERVRLSQSVAIVEYLEERWPEPALLPRAALARARVREALEIVNSGMQPVQNSSTLAEVKRLLGDDAVAPWARAAMLPGLWALETHAARHAGSCLVGDQPSWADAYLVPQLYNARRYGVELAAYPRLLAVESYLNGLPAFAAARPEAQPDAVLQA